MSLIAKRLAYRSGLLGCLHRRHNRDTLTVAMFHRVLPETDRRHPGADPEWTMSPATFDGCLAFFQRHYRIQTPEQVFAAMRGEAVLPARSLLITFDDGWADTAQYAAPLLQARGLPALIFVAGAAVGSAAPFWEEQVYATLSCRPQAIDELGIPELQGQRGEAAQRRAIALLGKMDAPRRNALVAALGSDASLPPAMMSAAELRAIAAAGLTIGGHGMVHAPLTMVADANAELAAAQASLAAHLGAAGIASMSFPHGAQSPAVIAACRRAGYRYLFSSKAALWAAGALDAAAAPVGRIHISERAICSGKTFEPALLATWLFRRPIAGARP